jgi:transcriptional regulator with XRE-family HTH domain
MVATRTARPYTLGKRTPVDDTTRQEWAERLRAARQRRGMTQQDLAACLGYTRATVSAWERALVAPPLAARIGIAEVLHRDVARLFPVRKRRAA